MLKRELCLSQTETGYRASFFAMASDCEVLIESDSWAVASQIGGLVAEEVWRLQDKYSRYQPESWLSQLNQSSGQWCSLDSETAGLFDFIDQIYDLSNGLFDPTSGILRRVWLFDGQHSIPDQSEVEPLLSSIGWREVKRTADKIKLPKGFELDLGGLVKEWAADKALAMLQAASLNEPVLINLGGDLRVSGPRKNRQPWSVCVRDPLKENSTVQVALSQGGIATSGDEHRFIEYQGKRYGHLLNPKTGWPIPDAPRSATVAAPTCLLSGVLSSLALLKGGEATSFLKDQNVLHWVQNA
ncbi:FAD:protein FMN transferase [Thiomicrorhabdus indica]|uniref:FAD:protein FMN transferase n=1 Tax=Thiomicrorhabdus indica TaxID=2267253 RepID=UPI002AA94650|nr:FAD:protein FMN transferase [Thiomicrorhabdus indica]